MLGRGTAHDALICRLLKREGYTSRKRIGAVILKTKRGLLGSDNWLLVTDYCPQPAGFLPYNLLGSMIKTTQSAPSRHPTRNFIAPSFCQRPSSSLRASASLRLCVENPAASVPEVSRGGKLEFYCTHTAR